MFLSYFMFKMFIVPENKEILQVMNPWDLSVVPMMQIIFKYSDNLYIFHNNY